MIWWTGWGWLSPVLVVPSVVFAVMALDNGTNVFLVSAVALSGCAANFVISKKINQGKSEKIYTDSETGKRISIDQRSTAYSMPMEYFSFIGVALIVLILIENSF